jgi:hypothetical protein
VEIREIRPHHLKVAVHYMSLDEQQRREFLDTLRPKYGDTFIDKAAQVFSDLEAGGLFKILMGEDELCRTPCKFLESCRTGDYRPIAEALFGGAVDQRVLTPDQADRLVLKQLGPVIDKVCYLGTDDQEKQHI